MATSVYFPWPSFRIDVSKVNIYLRTNLTSNYDGIICNTDSLIVIFKLDYSDTDFNILNIYWTSLNSNSFNPTLNDLVTAKINDAIVFGNNVIIQASVENILMGITQAGKTKIVSDYLDNMQSYLRSGSLYAAIDELNLLLSQTIPSELSPFVTTVRLTSYKNSIQDYLGIPRT